jgi:thiol:disulfide interchange protein
VAKVEMELERDLFTVTASKDQPSEAEMIAAVEGRGFKARVRRPGEPPERAAGPSRESSPAVPALIQEALDRAQREKKLVLVDFYADWCLPCKRMLQETYKDPEIASELEHFVFLKVDTDAHPGVSKRFGVSGIPDARVLKPDGTEVARFVGFKSPIEVLEVLRAVRGTSDGNK